MENFRNIPTKLKSQNRWGCYKLEFNKKRNKFGKIPKNAKTGLNAKVNDMSTWHDYETAVAAINKYKFDGIGILLGNGVFGIDLDNVILDGELSSEAKDIIQTMDSYTEFSPSGNGIHILCEGNIPPGARRKGNVEMYSDGRFFTITGNLVDNRYKELMNRTEQAKIVHNKYLNDNKNINLSKENKKVFQNINYLINLSDQELLEKAMSAKNKDKFIKLWSGDITGYTSHSDADQALCDLLAFWTGSDASRMDSLFRQSGLYRENKWNSQRPIWGTYGWQTIYKAIDDCTVHYTPKNKETIQQSGKKAPSTAMQGAKENKTLNISYQQGTKDTIPTVETPRPDSVKNYIKDFLRNDIEKFKSYKDRKTGFENLDRLTGGLYPGLYVIGATSSLGKTTFIHQLCDQLAESGDHVLFFSLEQTRLELVTKSLSRIMAKKNPMEAISAIDIRSGAISPGIREAALEYNEKVASNVNIVECNFSINIFTILDYIDKYIEINKVKPIVVIDYLQIIPPTDPRQGDKEKVDNIVRGLKKIQSEKDLVLFGISSINRSNYLNPIDFESFKESGGLEYTADVVWGLQLQVLNEDIFNKEKNIKEKRERIRLAKREVPRKIELVCLKSRYGTSSYSCGFSYDQRFDFFKPDYGFEVECLVGPATSKVRL